MPYLYRHIRLDKNEPFYIGIGSDKSYNRAYEKGNRRNKIWNKIVNKTTYEVEILLDDITWEHACQKEIEFINLYGRIDLKSGTLANLTDGGDGTIGIIYSEERKKELSNKMKNNPKSWEHLLTPKSKLKSTLSLKGRRAPNKGIPMSEEQKQKLSLSKKGNCKPWNKGMKNVNGKGMAKVVLDTNTGIFYESCKEASLIYNIKHSTLKSMLNGSNKNKTNLIYI